MTYRLILLFLSLSSYSKAQYYLRGEIKDDKNNLLPYVRIYVHSTGAFFYSGSSGSFGIPSSVKSDSATFSLNSFQTKTIALADGRYEYISLTPVPSRLVKRQDKLLSLIRDKKNDKDLLNRENGETYSQLVENEFVSADAFPVTGFALNVDKASYSNIRRFINTRSIVPPDAVRIEEILNYFPQKEEKVDSPANFKFSSQISDCPWNSSSKLLMMQLRARKINFDSLPPSNIVLLIDISGSMDQTNRLPLLKTAFRMMVENLRPIDTLSIVAYGGSVIVALPPTAGNEKKKILDVMEDLSAGGETPGEHALNTAYALAKSQFIKDGNNRIILATDGDFNVGQITEESLMELVANKQQMGIYLTCLGVGVGNYKDSKLELMAKKGNGNFAYIDNVYEAEKVLVKELMQTLFAVVDDAYLDVRFDPRYVQQYRLIGYENKKRSRSDTTTVLEGGEIGSGHVATAIFELLPTASFMSADAVPAIAELSYMPKGEKVKKLEKLPCLNNYKSLLMIDSSYRFSASAAMFGLLLKQSSSLGEIGWDDLQKLAITAVNPKDFWQAEFLTLIQKAKSLYAKGKKKKKF
jgi:Ca-activated chloride channel family protein